MATSVAYIAASDEVEAVYRQDADRLWRALYAYAGNEEVASDAVADMHTRFRTLDNLSRLTSGMTSRSEPWPCSPPPGAAALGS